MTTLHIQEVAGHALVPRDELEQLIALAQRSEQIKVDRQPTAETSTRELAQLAQQGGAFDWLAAEENLYSTTDLKVRYR